MRIRSILLLIIVLLFCSYIDKNNLTLNQLARNKYIYTTFYTMKNIGSYINNKDYSHLANEINAFIGNIESNLNKEQINEVSEHQTNNLKNKSNSIKQVNIGDIYSNTFIKIKEVVDILFN